VNASVDTANKVVDGFVSYLNAAGFQPKFEHEVPEELRTSRADHGMFYWQIRSAASNAWVQSVIETLPQGWPKPFRSLIDRYRFCSFYIGPIMFFANSGHPLFYELSSRVFADKGIFPLLHANGFAQFGLPNETNYDPVCFDMKRRKGTDAPIVQLDHEEILLRSRIKLVQEIAPSFMQFMEDAIAQRLPVE
jgi:hypothetical protein